MIWERANRMKSILAAKEVFTRKIFDDVLQSKKVSPLGRRVYTSVLLLTDAGEQSGAGTGNDLEDKRAN